LLKIQNSTKGKGLTPCPLNLLLSEAFSPKGQQSTLEIVKSSRLDNSFAHQSILNRQELYSDAGTEFLCAG
jgi:hypothetical protein